MITLMTTEETEEFYRQNSDIDQDSYEDHYLTEAFENYEIFDEDPRNN